MAAVIQQLGTRISSRLRAWARHRQGDDPSAVTLESRRIYILPTKSGFLFGIIVFTMLLGAMNYNNNLGFVLSFLLAGIAVISMHHCHRNLKDIRLRFMGVEPVFAGQRLRYEFLLINPGATRRWQIRLGWADGDAVYADLDPDAQCRAELPLTTRQRGLIEMPALQISTRFPLGLFRAWAWIHMRQGALVYPRPLPAAPAPPAAAGGPQSAGRPDTGDDDFAGLRSYRPGDPPRQIAWKAMARSGEKLTKEYRGGTAAELMIDWNSISGSDIESRVSLLTRQVLDADTAGRLYGLLLPGARVPVGCGPQHRHECLKSLALLTQPPGA